VYEPAVVSRRPDGTHSVGIDALLPDMRRDAKTVYPFRLNDSMDHNYDMKGFEQICECVKKTKQTPFYFTQKSLFRSAV